MKKVLQERPFHVFLIGLYIILFMFVRNIHEVSLPMTFRAILFSLVVAAAVLGVSYVFLRSMRKAGIFSTIFIIGFYLYGFIYDQFEALYYKGYWPFEHIHRFLAGAYAVFFLILFIVFLRSKRPHYNVNYSLNVFVLFLIGTNLLMLAFRGHSEGNIQKANFFYDNNRTPLVSTTKNRPDIYYIILDGFASEGVLRRDYGDNDPYLYRFLKERNFYIADSARTNYPYTYQSLTSSLNMNYLDSVGFEPAHSVIDRNLVAQVVKKNGYRFIDLESGFAISDNQLLADKSIPIPGLNEFERRLLELTVFRLDNVLGFAGYKRVIGQLDQLPQFLKEPGPKFSLIHIVAPHPPYVVDSNGKQLLLTQRSDMAWEPRESYLGQAKYIARRATQFIDTLLKSSAQPPIIILQSDHGPWIRDQRVSRVWDSRTRILSAYYGPDSLRAQLYPTITPVNSFRAVFRTQFGLDFPNLPDRQFQIDSAELEKNLRLWHLR